jgi:hypothetical protein
MFNLSAQFDPAEGKTPILQRWGKRHCKVDPIPEIHKKGYPETGAFKTSSLILPSCYLSFDLLFVRPWGQSLPAMLALRLVAAMLTLASRPDTKGFSAAPTKPDSIAAAAEGATISFINSRRSTPGQDRTDPCLLVKIALLYLSLSADLGA